MYFINNNQIIRTSLYILLSQSIYERFQCPQVLHFSLDDRRYHSKHWARDLFPVKLIKPIYFSRSFNSTSVVLWLFTARILFLSFFWTNIAVLLDYKPRWISFFFFFFFEGGSPFHYVIKKLIKFSILQLSCKNMCLRIIIQLDVSWFIKKPYSYSIKKIMCVWSIVHLKIHIITIIIMVACLSFSVAWHKYGCLWLPNVSFCFFVSW